MTIGEKIKQVIEDKGLIKKWVAEKMGVTPQALNGLFLRDNVDTKTLSKLSVITNTPIGLFFEGIDIEMTLNEDSPPYQKKTKDKIIEDLKKENMQLKKALNV